MCLGRHTRRNENGAPRRVLFRSAVTRSPVRWGVPQSAGATALVSSARTMQESPRATVPMGVFREVRRLAQRTGPGALSSRAPSPSGLGRGLEPTRVFRRASPAYAMRGRATRAPHPANGTRIEGRKTKRQAQYPGPSGALHMGAVFSIRRTRTGLQDGPWLGEVWPR